MKTVKIIHHVEIDFYFISVEIFKIETFSSRLRCVEIFIEIIETFETNQDKSRFFEIFEGNRDFVRINRDFVEINRDFFSLDRDILDVWKVVVGEGFTLTFLSLPWVTF